MWHMWSERVKVIFEPKCVVKRRLKRILKHEFERNDVVNQKLTIKKNEYRTEKIIKLFFI